MPQGGQTATYTGPGVSTNVGGLIGRTVPTGPNRTIITAGYFDSASGAPGSQGQTTDDLQMPTEYGNTGIYSTWNVDVDGEAPTEDNPWGF